jgi:hypothetical protein
MKKTNSKEYLNNIRKMILENIEEGETTKEKLSHVLKCFDSEFNFKNNKLRYPNLELRLSNWLMGLPSAVYVPFTYFDIIQTAKKLHEVDELTEKQEDRIIELNFYHWASQILRFASVEKIDMNKLY